MSARTRRRYAPRTVTQYAVSWEGVFSVLAKGRAATLADLQAAAGALGINTILGADQLKQYFRDPATDSRTPDFLVVSEKGVIYTHGSKLAEHGGLAEIDILAKYQSGFDTHINFARELPWPLILLKCNNFCCIKILT